MSKQYNDHYLSEEVLADMRYESTEDLAKKALGVFAFITMFGGGIVSALCTFLGA